MKTRIAYREVEFRFVGSNSAETENFFFLFPTENFPKSSKTRVLIPLESLYLAVHQPISNHFKCFLSSPLIWVSCNIFQPPFFISNATKKVSIFFSIDFDFPLKLASSLSSSLSTFLIDCRTMTMTFNFRTVLSWKVFHFSITRESRESRYAKRRREEKKCKFLSIEALNFHQSFFTGKLERRICIIWKVQFSIDDSSSHHFKHFNMKINSSKILYDFFFTLPRSLEEIFCARFFHHHILIIFHHALLPSKYWHIFIIWR